MRVATPTVILIGGPPGAGKTTLGRALAARLRVASVTVDDLVVAARAVTSERSHPALFPMTRAGGHVRYFTEATSQDLIDDALALEACSWPMVEAVVRRHLAESSPIVLDWWLLRPAAVHELADPRISALFLHPTAELLWKRERANSWTDASPTPERMLENFMGRSLWRNDLIEDEARSLAMPVLDLDGSEAPADIVDLACDALGVET